MKDSDNEFKVVDKRHERDESDVGGAAAQGSSADSGGHADSGTEEALGGHDRLRDEVPPPPADFTALVVSLASSAYLHLGEIPDPEGRQPVLNLEVARHTIDMLAMLRDKTRGNLTPEEGQILQRFLYDLRLKFVAAVERK